MTNRTFESCARKFEITAADMAAMVSDFHNEMEAGLEGRDSSLKMIPTFVDRATGNEEGSYIALDLGGTNFRVLDVRLDGRGGISVEHVGKYVIPTAVMRGTGEQLFNFIAGSISDFVNANKIDAGAGRKLGFTFSFPVKQTAVARGILINWTKDFSATGVVGSDVVELLSKALEGYGLGGIRISALLNDTVGTLVAKSYEDPGCDVGVIFGTGTNACYRERMGRIKKLSGAAADDHMIVNIEWGNFSKSPANEFDRMLDQASGNPGQQLMEKKISGMYMGELARLLISDLIAEKGLFAGRSVSFARGQFESQHMSLIEADGSVDLAGVKRFLEGMGIREHSLEDRSLLKQACLAVSDRAAKISAAALSAVFTWMDPRLEGGHAAAIDGSVYEKHPGFRERVLDALRELHGEKAENLALVSAKDGSGVGAAVVAAVAAGA
ncbi:MAG: hypothetical protein JXA24_07755 [Proteobacteria bacterium]|nr:hypothetical protein [Pseudomonadota bacterium]